MFFVGAIHDAKGKYDRLAIKKSAESKNPYDADLIEVQNSFIDIWYSNNKCIFNDRVIYLEFGNTKIVIIGNYIEQQITEEDLFHIYRKKSFDLIHKKSKGEYIIVFYCIDTKRVDIIKSPVSRFNCYYKFSHNMLVISSTLECFCGSDAQYILADKKHIKKYLASQLLQTDRLNSDLTPYNDVFKIINGSWIKLKNKSRKAKVIWKPTNSSFVSTSIEKTANELRRLLEMSLGKFLGSLSKKCDIRIFLSGGYDSSTVACLTEEIIKKHNYDFDVKYLHYLYDGKGNELSYAQQIAQVTQRNLKCLTPDADNAFLHDFFPLRRYSEPNEQVLYGHSEVLHKKDGDVFLNGCGGDHLLLASRESIVGLLKKPRLEWRIIIKNLAQKTNQNSFDLFFNCLLKKIKNTSVDHNEWLYDMCTNEYARKYLKGCRTIKYPKCFFDNFSQRNYERICSGTIFPNSDESGSVNYSPFYNQEVIEFCLNIPAYYKFDGNENRIVHKMAMADLLPQVVLDRNSKSSNEDFIKNAVKNNWSELYDFFKNSELENMGIIKPGKIQDILKQLEMGCCTDIPRAVKVITIETWLRSLKG